MKSFRGERQRKNASAQVVLAVLVLLTSIVLVNFLPVALQGNKPQAQTTIWESSVVKLP